MQSDGPTDTQWPPKTLRSGMTIATGRLSISAMWLCLDRVSSFTCHLVRCDLGISWLRM